MILEHKILVELNSCYEMPLITLKQYDSGHKIIFEVYKDEQRVDISDENARLFIRKPDGKLVYQNLIKEDSNVYLYLTNQALSAIGVAVAELEFQSIGTTDIVTSPIFKMRVMPTMIDDSAIESSDAFTALEEALAKIDKIPLDELDDLVERVKQIEDTRPTIEQVQSMFEPLESRVEALEAMDISSELVSDITLNIFLDKDGGSNGNSEHSNSEN